MPAYNLIIDGEKVSTAETFPVLNPATEEVVAQAPKATVDHLNQAVAAALDTARRAKMARGGSATHEGAIVSHIPGRTDKIPMDVKSGSFVIPADIVSGLGQGNTLAGIKKVQDMFENVAGFPAEADISEPVPIIAAGGEYVLSPATVKKYGKGDINRGHNELDKWVIKTRKELINTLKNLPGPAKD